MNEFDRGGRSGERKISLPPLHQSCVMVAYPLFFLCLVAVKRIRGSASREPVDLSFPFSRYGLLVQTESNDPTHIHDSNHRVSLLESFCFLLLLSTNFEIWYCENTSFGFHARRIEARWNPSSAPEAPVAVLGTRLCPTIHGSLHTSIDV